MPTIKLPQEDGTWIDYTIDTSKPKEASSTETRPSFNRIAYAAAHVVPKKGSTTEVDWEATIAYRHRLWSYGLGVAEAMDTAQRGMGLSYEMAKELIKRSIEASKTMDGALLANGCGTDQLMPDPKNTLDDIINAYEEQLEYVEGLGGKVILMASRALAASAKSPEDYAKVYDRVLSQVKQPVIIHWLGEMFDPSLKGYWGKEDHYEAMDVANDIMTRHHNKVDGIKISLLDANKEIAMRNQLHKSVNMYTGDDFNYPELIVGDSDGYSHALLGIFDAIAPAASEALAALAKDDLDAYYHIFNPTVPLSRHIFSAPTRYYKTGVVFLAWLNGFQDEFKMIDGQETGRSKAHLAETFRLAAEAGALVDVELALERVSSMF